MVKGGANKHFAIVRGVSVNTSVGDIVKFFSRVVNPKNVELKFEPGTSKGDVVVELHTHADAMKSMLLDKETLGRLGNNVQVLVPGVRPVRVVIILLVSVG